MPPIAIVLIAFLGVFILTIGLFIRIRIIRFVMVLLISAAFLTVGVFLLAADNRIPWPSYFFEILGYTAVSTLIVFSLLHKTHHPTTFVQLYLLSMVIKLSGGMAFILIVIHKDRIHSKPNAAFFLLAYITFTIVEVAFLYGKNSRNRGRI